jgi:hypothetical protein
VSSKSTPRPSQHRAHEDHPKKPSWPRGKPHSGASNAHHKLETHKVSKCPSVTKTPKSSWLSNDAQPLDNSSWSPGGFSDNILLIQSVPETHKVSAGVQTCPALKSIQHNGSTQSDRDIPSSLEPNASNIHHIHDILETHKVSYHTLPAPALKPQFNNHQGLSSDLPQLLRSLLRTTVLCIRIPYLCLVMPNHSQKSLKLLQNSMIPLMPFGQSYQWMCV